MTAPHESLRFPFRIGRRSRVLLRCWGVDGDRDAVALSEDALAVDFGFAHLRIPLANVARWRIEGPWSWLTAIGIRMSLRKREVSFQGSPRGGVRLEFRERLRWGPIRMPAIWVGVDDLEGLGAALSARGIPGEDARTRHDA
jgi:hypothetical protein